MSDAIAKPSKRKGPDPREDAFLRFVNRVVDWITGNLQAVIAAAVVVVLLAGAGFWYLNYTQNLEEQAASELQSLRTALSQGTETVGAERLESFVDQYAGTESERQARLLLGRLHLREGAAEEAIEAVEPAAGAPPDTPVGYAALSLLAKAQEAAGRTDPALGTLETLAEDARFPFQRDQAAADRARILTESGRLEEAEAIYSRLAEEASGSGARQIYAARLGEVRARLEAAGPASGGATSSSEASTSSGDDASASAGGGSEEASPSS
jgi:predicted negative regulator of RcsB-dependent stress response